MTGRRRGAPWRRALLATACCVAASVGAAPADQVVLEPVRDTTIFSEAALSNGMGSALFAGNSGSGATRRALLRFDVAGALPAGATITAAALTLRATTPIPRTRTVTLHRVLADWGEAGSNSDGDMGGGRGDAAEDGDATWQFAFYDTQAWTTAGGDFAAAPSATQQSSASTVTWTSTATLVADVQSWLDNPAANFGWLVRGEEDDNSSALRFGSREASSVNRPKLMIDFVAPGGGATPTATAGVATATATPTPAAPTATASAVPTATASAAPPNTATAPAATATAPATIASPGTPTATAAAPTPTATLPPAATATGSATATGAIAVPTATATPVCTGDCNRSGDVAINELILGVGIAIGAQPLDACPAFDRSGNGSVEINELIVAVNNALEVCF